MEFKQRDIISIQYEGTDWNHPHIIISNDHFNDAEYGYLVVMMSATKRPSEFALPVTRDDLTKPLTKEHGFAKLNMIDNVKDEDLYKPKYLGRMKIEPFKRLLREINDRVFSDEGNE
ncbi:MAG: mRNA-degrading endonuclease toxin of MazEF toxin-antitoxin module [Bacteroidia bacterium]|jgi:mRNA-degrading endonuclease toxin of MazEF toxin-antitoxin module